MGESLAKGAEVEPNSAPCAVHRQGVSGVAESIYRQAALDRLANPERLDAPISLVGRPAWLLLGTFAVAIVAALAWSILTSAPVKVGAQGVLIDRTGFAEIVATDEGRVDRLLVAPGDRVTADQPIATVARTELVREIEDARAKLADAQARYRRLSGFYGNQNVKQAGADATRIATMGETRRALTERETFLAEKARRMEGLIDRGFIPRDRLVDTQIELADVRERISNLGEAAMRVRIEADSRSGTSGLALLDERRTVEEQQRLIERLTARLTDQELVRARTAGRIAEIKVNTGDVVTPGTALATVVPDATSNGLVALLYVPAAEGKRIEIGMAAEIVPSTVEKSVYGHIPGRVVAVAPLPATAEGMRRVLRNDQLVQELIASGAPIEVRVALNRDASTPSGFAWSASRGPTSRISAGSIVGGQVVVDRKPVIALLIPRAGD